MNLSLRDILAEGVGHWLSKQRNIRDCIFDKPIKREKNQWKRGLKQRKTSFFTHFRRFGMLRQNV
jgi:hypothetical protein